MASHENHQFYIDLYRKPLIISIQVLIDGLFWIPSNDLRRKDRLTEHRFWNAWRCDLLHLKKVQYYRIIAVLINID